MKGELSTIVRVVPATALYAAPPVALLWYIVLISSGASAACSQPSLLPKRQNVENEWRNRPEILASVSAAQGVYIGAFTIISLSTSSLSGLIESAVNDCPLLVLTLVIKSSPFTQLKLQYVLSISLALVLSLIA